MSEASDKMLKLLQEISVLKELDEQHGAVAQGRTAKKDLNERRKKRREIRTEMKQLAAVAREKVPNQS